MPAQYHSEVGVACVVSDDVCAEFARGHICPQGHLQDIGGTAGRVLGPR